MQSISLDPLLQEEFATVEAILRSNAATKNLDALLLSWVKYEKQLRRLFSYLIFQHPQIDKQTVKLIASAMLECKELYPSTLMKCIAHLRVTPVPKLVGNDYDELHPHIRRIQGYRNKLMHGLNTGAKLSSQELTRDIGHLVQWVGAVARGAMSEFGYDGLGRNTYQRARAARKICVERYPFAELQDFPAWLHSTVKS